MTRRLVLLAAIAVFASPAAALDMPARKPGLWELKMAFEGNKIPPRVMQQCIDAATDKMMNADFGGAAQENCSKRDVQNTGGVITIDSVCKFGSATTTSHAVVTGRFDSGYTVDVTSTRAGGAPVPGMPATGSTHIKLEAKWLGACAGDQKPGDMMMGNGMKMNVLELQKMRGAPKP